MQIYINKNGQQLGPFEETVVRQMLQSGQLSSNDLGIRQGQNQWSPLGSLFPKNENAQNARQVPNPPLLPGNQPTATAAKKSGSKTWLFVLLGLGGLFLVGAVGLAVLLSFAGKKSNAPLASDLNSNASNTASKNSPVKTSETNYKSLLDKAEEFAKMSPPSKIEVAPTIKGKIVLVEKNKESPARIIGIDYEGKKLQSSDIEGYGFSTSRLASNANEIGTLIQFSCAKGNRIGTYEGGIAAFSNICQTTVVDYRTPAIVAQKTFTNNSPPDNITTYSKDSSGEYVLPKSNELGEYLAGLPLEKLPTPLVELPFDSVDGAYGKYTGFRNLASEMARVAVPEKIDANASIKGKFAYVLRDADGRAELKGFDGMGKNFQKYDYEKWGVGSERLAENIAEVETLVRVVCQKGERLGAVRRTTVFAQKCEVSIIDYQASNVVAKKSFENKKMETDVDTKIYPSRYVVLYPYTEMDEYVKSFPK